MRIKVIEYIRGKKRDLRKKKKQIVSKYNYPIEK